MEPAKVRPKAYCLLEPDSGSIYLPVHRAESAGYVSVMYPEVGTFHGGFPATVEEIVLPVPSGCRIISPTSGKTVQVDAALAGNMRPIATVDAHYPAAQQRVLLPVPSLRKPRQVVR